MKHHSATFAIAAEAGVHERTVRRYLSENLLHHEPGQWYNDVCVDAAVRALQRGREVCQNQPRRHAPGLQLALEFS